MHRRQIVFCRDFYVFLSGWYLLGMSTEARCEKLMIILPSSNKSYETKSFMSSGWFLKTTIIKNEQERVLWKWLKIQFDYNSRNVSGTNYLRTCVLQHKVTNTIHKILWRAPIYHLISCLIPLFLLIHGFSLKGSK